MMVLRKIFGIFLLFFSGVFILALLSSGYSVLSKIPGESSAERVGYIIGVLSVDLLFGFLIYFMIKRGLFYLKDTKN